MKLVIGLFKCFQERLHVLLYIYLDKKKKVLNPKVKKEKENTVRNQT